MGHKRLVLSTVWATLTLLLFVTFLLSDRLVPYDPYLQDLGSALLPPSAEHLFGTDQLGRDLFSRVLVGGKVTVFSSLLIVCITVLIGSVVGILAGFFGGHVDQLLMRLSDVFLAFPGIVFAIAIAGLLGGGLTNAIIALCVISWPKFARLARAETLKVKRLPFVEVAQMNRIPIGLILTRHIFKNIFHSLFTTAIIDLGAIMMELAGLSFIGLGVTAPTAEWGAMLQGSISLMQTSPFIVMAPIGAIFITVSLLNLLGESIKNMADFRS